MMQRYALKHEPGRVHARQRATWWLGTLVITVTVLGCTGSSPTEDAGTRDDAAPASQLDSGSGMSMCAAFPTPQLGIAAEAVALASAPARCGQSSYRWLDGASLGDVLEVRAPERFLAAVLNAVLSSEGVRLGRMPSHDVEVRQFLYRTQDRGVSIDASALVAYPIGRDLSDAPLTPLLFLHGTSGFNDDCAPSNLYEWQALTALLASFGDRIVVAPDFIGLKAFGEPTGFVHPYIAGQPTAIASLDALRAVGKMTPEQRGGRCIAPEYLVFGGSQGGHAALWVDRLGAYYAPELTSLGTVATVPPADVFGQAERALQSLVEASGNTLAMLGTLGTWYGHEARFDEVLVSPFDTLVPEVLATSCRGEGISAPTALEEVFTPALLSAAADGTLRDWSPWGCIFLENGLTTTSIAPLGTPLESHSTLFVLAGEDTLVHTPIERASFNVLCDQGMRLELLECAGSDHDLATLYALPETLDFLDARVRRQVPSQVCELNAPVRCRGMID